MQENGGGQVVVPGVSGNDDLLLKIHAPKKKCDYDLHVVHAKFYPEEQVPYNNIDFEE